MKAFFEFIYYTILGCLLGGLPFYILFLAKGA